MSRFNDHDRASLNILLERIDPACNMARYYVLSIEPTLFGDQALIRGWGRIGSKAGSAGNSLRTTLRPAWRLRPGLPESVGVAIARAYRRHDTIVVCLSDI
jgi:hypothetical protein